MRGGIDRRGLTAICCMLLAAAVGTACGEDADTASTGNGGQLASRDYKVNIVAGAYKPARLRVRVGDTVTWINRGEAPNTAENHTKGGFDTHVLYQYETKTIKLRRPGRYRYTSSLGPSLSGLVEVMPRNR